MSELNVVHNVPRGKHACKVSDQLVGSGGSRCVWSRMCPACRLPYIARAQTHFFQFLSVFCDDFFDLVFFVMSLFSRQTNTRIHTVNTAYFTTFDFLMQDLALTRNTGHTYRPLRKWKRRPLSGLGRVQVAPSLGCTWTL